MIPLEPDACLCGCGEPPQTKLARYRPGHDARHAADVARRLRALGGADDRVLAELPSLALRRKALAILASESRAGTSTALDTLHGELTAVAQRGTSPADDRTTADLLAGYATTLAELRRRGVIRSNNAPAGDYGEWLVAKALGATIVANAAMKSYDLTMADGRRVQVKARVVGDPVRRGQLQASVFRSFDFDLAALVLLRDLDYAVHRAVLVPVNVVQALSTRVEHVNGWRLMMTAEILDHQEAEDITAAMRQAACEASAAVRHSMPLQLA